MTHKVTGYHKQMVVDYYLNLLTQFGPTPLLRHMPKLKKLVWTEAGLGMLESHKTKREKQRWSA